MSPAALVFEAVTVARGARTVVHGVDIDVPAGGIVALLGPNGAGKTSLVLAAGGVLPLAGGRIVLDGRPLPRHRPDRARAAGLAVVPEGHRVLGELSVLDNLRVAGSSLARPALTEGVDAALARFPELAERLGQRAGSLSGGQQQMLALAQATVARPRFLVIDELSFGLAPIVVRRLVPELQALAAEGVGILLIEQFAAVALELAGTVHLMDRGRIRHRGAAAELAAHPELLHSAYLPGGTAPSPAGPFPESSGLPI